MLYVFVILMGVQLIFHKFLNDRVYQGLIYGLTPLLIEYVLKTYTGTEND